MCVSEWVAIAERHWKGLRALAATETEEWIRHSNLVGQPLTEEGLRWWLERVYAGCCVVCAKKSKEKLCADHRAAMEALRARTP